MADIRLVVVVKDRKIRFNIFNCRIPTWWFGLLGLHLVFTLIHIYFQDLAFFATIEIFLYNIITFYVLFKGFFNALSLDVEYGLKLTSTKTWRKGVLERLPYI